MLFHNSVLLRAVYKIKNSTELTEEEREAVIDRVAHIPAVYQADIAALEARNQELERAVSNAHFKDYTEQEYWQCVKRCAQEIFEENSEEACALNAAEQTSWCIYNYGQKAVLVHSNNLEAWQDVGLALGQNPIGVIAVCAMGQDIEEALQELRDNASEEGDADEEEESACDT